MGELDSSGLQEVLDRCIRQALFAKPCYFSRARVTTWPRASIRDASPFGRSLVEKRHIPGVMVQIGRVPLDGQLLIRRQGMGLQPSPASSAEQLASIGWDQVGMEDAVDPVLHPGHLLHHLSSLRHKPPQSRLLRLVSRPRAESRWHAAWPRPWHRPCQS